eukprot:TRINITY_DN1375_c1_g1_i1.p1 TRINITY_DN1375_c1_g1~~TRINITY_DN1375_c1_g1_i1.p1  ORF type:complete len:292 (+),score=83.16 TRINITY_DN1375_c1_g1_i1:119-994(+)
MGNNTSKKNRKNSSAQTPPSNTNSSSSSSVSSSNSSSQSSASERSVSSPPAPRHVESHSNTNVSNNSSGSSHTPQKTSSESKSSSSSLEVSDKSFSQKRLDELFDKYKEENGAQIGPEGIERLCHDLSVDPEDIVVMVMAWQLNAATMGFFSRDEFINGLKKLNVDSIPKFKNELKNFQKDLDDPAKFKEIYRFAFGFAKEKDQKILDLATADAMLHLMLGSASKFPHTENLREFLKEQTQYKSINLDQWMNILEFSRTIKADLSNYDENSAWPVILDSYCEWSQERMGKN